MPFCIINHMNNKIPVVSVFSVSAQFVKMSETTKCSGGPCATQMYRDSGI